jgi:hypothetical protein
MAAITGEARFAATARTIILGWAGSLQTVSGADAVLMAGLGPFKMINAAEILRATGQLDAPGAERFAAMLLRAILPAILDFAPFANGNWDTAAIKTMLAIAVFCDDRALFERALAYFRNRVGAHGEDFEAQPRGRDLLKVVSVGEEGKYLVDGACNPLLTAQYIVHSTHSFPPHSTVLLRFTK